MIKWFKQEKGVTLIELLASLALLSVVIILIGSVHIFGQRQFVSQTEANSQANDLRYSLAMISREARSADTFKVKDDSTEITINGDRYHLDKNNNRLMLNNTILSARVYDFKVELQREKQIKITIKSLPNQMNQSEVYETTIYPRTASNGDDTDD